MANNFFAQNIYGQAFVCIKNKTNQSTDGS